MTTKTITLLGDSIFDNARYVGDEPCVADQIEEGLTDWNVDLRATDGAPVREVLTDQLRQKPENGVIVLSAGGNDALNSLHLLEGHTNAWSIEFWRGCYRIRETFRKDYAQLLDTLTSYNLPVAVCTIYNPDYSRIVAGKILQKMAAVGVALFNDVIVREALRRSLHVIDLRDICTTAADFVNVIEPSSIGGRKIADKICAWAEKSQRHAVA
ncbi:MAG: SGNH/GDSL hydrolase family protein [Hyphomicrobiaceae bacterium]